VGKNDTARKVATGALIAGAVGYLAGILTAPKSGRETRADIRSAATRAMREAEKQLKYLHAELSALLEEAAALSSRLNERGRKELNTLTEKAKIAKQEAREALSAIHEGDADDPELKMAVKDAENASKHLRKFLAKKAA